MFARAQVASFLASQSASWLVLYGALAANPALAVLLPPELAIGMVVSKVTRKFRQPANLALAAGVVQVFPAITALKVRLLERARFVVLAPVR